MNLIRNHLCFILLILILSGCTPASKSVVMLVDALNARNLSSCVEWDIMMGGGMGASGHAAVHGKTTTGNATFEQCNEALE